MDGSAGGSAQICFGQTDFKPQIRVDSFQTSISERSAGGSAQISFGQQYLSLGPALTLSAHIKWKGPLEALPKFILGRNILKPQIGFGPFFQTETRRSTGGSAKILLGQQFFQPQIGIDAFHSQEWECQPESVTNFILGRRYLCLKFAFDPSKYKLRMGRPEALPRFILVKKFLSLSLVLHLFSKQELESSTGGSAQVPSGQQYPSLKSALTLSALRFGRVSRRLCPSLHRAEIS